LTENKSNIAIKQSNKKNDSSNETKEMAKSEALKYTTKTKEIAKVEPLKYTTKTKEIAKVEPLKNITKTKETVKVEPLKNTTKTKEMLKIEPSKNTTKAKSVAKNDDDLIDNLVNEAMNNLDTNTDVSKLIKNNENDSMKNTKPIKTAATYLPAKKK